MPSTATQKSALLHWPSYTYCETFLPCHRQIGGSSLEVKLETAPLFHKLSVFLLKCQPWSRCPKCRAPNINSSLRMMHLALLWSSPGSRHFGWHVHRCRISKQCETILWFMAQVLTVPFPGASHSDPLGFPTPECAACGATIWRPTGFTLA